MGVIEEEFNRSRNQASLLTPGGGKGLTAPPAAAATPAPQRAALLTTPSPGQQLRAAIAQQPASNLAETVAARNPGAVPAPDLRAQLSRPPQGPSLKDAMASRAPVGPEPDLRTQLTRAPQGQTLGEAMANRAPVGPEPDMRTRLTRPQQGPSLGETIASRTPVGPPPPDLRAQLGRPQQGPTLAETVASRAPVGPPAPDLRAQLERPRTGPTLGEAIKSRQPVPRVQPVSMQALLDKVPGHSQAFAGGPAPAGATAGAAGAAPAGAAAGAAAAAPKAAGEGWYTRATNAASAAAKPMMPAGSGVIGKAAAMAGTGMLGAAKKALPYVEPVVEAARVGRVALDKNSDGYDVATQVAEGAGRIGTTVAGAGIGGSIGAAVGGPFAPVTGFLGAVGGGIAGYAGGDAAIKKLRSVFGLETASPVEKTDERYDIAKAARAAAAASKAGTPAAAATAPKATKPVAAAATVASAAPTVKAGTAAPAPVGMQGVLGGPAEVNPALAQQLEALQAQQDASPIARTVIGGGGSQVFYKDGSMSPLQPGQPMPDDVAQFNAVHSQMRALRSGRPAPQGDAGGPAAVRSAGAAPANLLPTQQVLHTEAVSQGYDPLRAMMISSIETGGKFDASAKNPKSSAFGLVQMTKANRDSYGLSPEQWADPAVQARTGIDFMKKTDAALTSQLGRAPTPAESYMGHLFGASGAASVLRSDPNQPMLDVVRSYDPKNANAIVNNNGMKGMTVGQAVAKWTQLTDSHMAQLGGLAQQGGAQLAAAAQGALVPQVASGVNTPVHIIKGMQQSMAIPNGEGYDNVPMTVYNAARRSSNGFDANGPVANYLDNVNQNANFAANPVSGELAKEAVRGQYSNRGQAIAGEYDVAQQQIMANAARAPYDPKVTTLGGGETLDPVTKMPVKQPTVGVYMKDGVPTYIPPPPQAQATRTPSQASIEHLRNAANDPALVAQFDATYGPGAAAQYLK